LILSTEQFMPSEHHDVSDREREPQEAIGIHSQANGGQAPDRQELLTPDSDLTRELSGYPQKEKRSSWPSCPEEEFRAQSFGDYELLVEIGRGGMGVVYKARQKSLDRLVALKRIRAGDLASRTELRRFRNEAQAAAHLDHPNILPIYEVGEQGGQPYFTMKLIETGSLTTRVGAGDWGPGDHETQRRVARIVANAARAVHHAHQRGILHRDLKPSNILLDADDQPFVSDFGLAKRVAGPGAQTPDAELTASGTFIGTPGYMAPEQAAPDVSPSAQSGKTTGHGITTAADVYGLGAVLYALLTGRAPFCGATLWETMAQVKNRDPEPPSRDRPNLSKDLESICLKCLEKEPLRRYRSAEDLAEDLERWLAGEPVRARSITRAARALRWCKRNPLVAGSFASTVVLLVVLIVGLATSTILIAGKAAEAKQQRELAQERERAVRRNLYVADIGRAYQAWRRADSKGFLQLLERNIPQLGEPDFRAFEWYHLWQLGHADELVLDGHRSEVCHIAYSPDGRQLASSSRDGTIKLWNAENGRQLETLHGHKGDVNSVTYSPDGKKLASGADDRTVKLWDVATRRELAILGGHGGDVMSVEFSPNGKLLASAGNKTILLWDVQQALATHTGRPIARLNRHTDRIYGLAFTPDGRHLWSGDYQGTVNRWDIVSLAKAPRESLPSAVPSQTFIVKDFRSRERPAWIRALACGRTRGLVMACADNTVKLYGPEHPGKGITDYWLKNAPRSVALSPDDSLIACGTEDGDIQILDGSLSESRTLLGHGGRVWSLAFSPKGDKLASASGDGTVRIWSLSNPSVRPKIFPQPCAKISALGFSPDGKNLVTGHHNGTARLWDVATWQLTGEFHVSRDCKQGKEKSGAITSIAWGPDGARLAFGMERGTACLADPTSKEIGAELPGIPGTQQFVAFSQDGKTLATGGNDVSGPTLRCWDVGTRALRFELEKTARAGANCMAFSRDGAKCAFCPGPNHDYVELCDVTSAQRPTRLTTSGHFVRSLGFSPDGKSLVAGASDGSMMFWDLPACELRITVGQDLKPMRDRYWDLTCALLAFSPDSKTLAAVGRDGYLRLWNVALGQELYAFGPLNFGDAVAFSPDGRTLVATVTTSDDLSLLYQWTAAPTEAVPSAQAPSEKAR
jgi:WD40 repeat protein/tRNA A-37 threonylcarbamoyl transferase component Bud32